MSGEYKEPETVEEWREASLRAGFASREREDALRAFALRLQPVCRNCVFAGAATVSGNYPYNNDWGSCRKRAPVVGPRRDLEQCSEGPTAVWPTVHHTHSCGEFALVPLNAKDAATLEEVRAKAPRRVTWANEPDKD